MNKFFTLALLLLNMHSANLSDYVNDPNLLAALQLHSLVYYACIMDPKNKHIMLFTNAQGKAQFTDDICKIPSHCLSNQMQYINRKWINRPVTATDGTKFLLTYLIEQRHTTDNTMLNITNQNIPDEEAAANTSSNYS